MKIITPGHKYELAQHESFGLDGCPVQTIQFIEKKEVPVVADGDAAGDVPKPGIQLVTVNDGTTNEEVFKMMIDRMEFLQAKMACDENEIVIRHLKLCLEKLNYRTAARKARAVEGTSAP